MQGHIIDILRLSLGTSPEGMLRHILDSAIRISGASGGSILGEEGPSLRFLFSNREDLIGTAVPLDSIAGATVSKGAAVYTYAPEDRRHFNGVDQQTKLTTRYLLSVPVPSVHNRQHDTVQARYVGALQLLFDENVFPGFELGGGPKEFDIEAFSSGEPENNLLSEVALMLPVTAFGLEVMNLRQTSYQAIHELKNKLIAGGSWLNYLKEDLESEFPEASESKNLAEDFELASDSINYGAELAKNYLQLTKIYSPDFTTIDIDGLLSRVSRSSEAFAAKSGLDAIEVRNSFSSECVELRGDGAQLEMAFFNICKNAIEALGEQGPDVPVLAISSRLVDGGRTEICITDNGPGMPREIADNLFVAFKTKKEGGTGLGLTIAKKITDIHGGEISCVTGSEGTTFRVVI